MHRTAGVTVVAMAMAFLAAPASAAVLNIVETTDLPTISDLLANPGTPQALMPGVNSVSGTVAQTFNLSTPPEDFEDAVALTLAPGLVVTQLKLTLDGLDFVNNAASASAEMTAVLSDPSFSSVAVVALQNIETLTTGAMTSIDTTLFDGDLLLAVSIGSSFSNGSASFAASYTAEVTVQAIPLPASAALLILGLGGLGVLRRRLV